GRGAGEVRRRGADRSLLEVLGRDADLLPGAPGRSLDRRRGRRLRSLGRHRPLGRIAEGRPGSAGVPPSHHGGAGAVAAPDKVKSLMDYGEYKHLTFERKPHGVVLITIDRPDVLNATNDRLHWELTQVWRTLDADDSARVAVVTGRGRAFSAGGGLDMVEANARDPQRLAGGLPEATEIVYNMINCDKPLNSPIHRVAAGRRP